MSDGLLVQADQAWGTGLPAEATPVLTREDPSPFRACLERALEAGPADLACLVWDDGTEPLVLPRTGVSPPPIELAQCPPPPSTPTLVAAGEGPWGRWCAERGFRSGVVAPVAWSGHPRGTVGLFAARPDRFTESDRDRLSLAAGWAADVWHWQRQASSLQRQGDEISHLLESALAISRTLEGRLRYESLVRSVGSVVDATYCRIAIRRGERLTIQGTGGRRPPAATPTRSWPIAEFKFGLQALKRGRPMVLRFDRLALAGLAERERLFSPTTHVGVIVPFAAAAGSEGLLLIGEERQGRHLPFDADRLAVLEYLGARVGELVQLARLLRRDRAADSVRRARRIERAERQRLARELHDDVGHGLSTILVRLRLAARQGSADADELKLLEAVTQRTLDETRALAYGLRRPEAVLDPIEKAHRFAEFALEAAGCRLTWLDERDTAALDHRSAVEIGRVISESVTNIVRHARATAAEIRLANRDGGVVASITDNGVGFSPSDGRLRPNGRGLGLRGNAERLRGVRGAFSIQGIFGTGTVVTARVPAS